MTAMQERSIFFGVLTSIFLTASAAAQPQLKGWHTARSPAEQALAAILLRAQQDPRQLDNLFYGRGSSDFHPTFDYGLVLTRALLSSVREAEKALLARDCQGQYHKGEVCGFDYLPISCTQDWLPTYLYKTQAAADDHVEISYGWPPGPDEVVATYRLIKQAGVWKINGIKCDLGVEFNWSLNANG